ncbi:hypothetical protein [Mobiluncus mulieris]|uniref:hypothetical protein n=1 Tax=Mobiluncus mulieris TaxID=2052 RepID=UPI00019F8EBC|nr:hypothetical protein [Mobiluncus mulieris]EEJ54701.1 hypothetical protein HMPREF0577_0224 [Mobiluncus mulieris ATCC 35243]
MEESSGTKTPGLATWQRQLGWIMIIVAGIGAVLAFLHLGGRVAHLGAGGLKLPAPDTWMGYQGSLGATLMLSAEQFAGLTSTWVAFLALTLALFTLDLGHIGNPRVRSMWREVITGTAMILFGFMVAILGLISAILLRDERMMLVEVPMPALALPALIFGVSALVVGTMRLVNTLKTLPATPQPQAPRKVERAAASPKPGQTSVPAAKAKPSQGASRVKGATKGSGTGSGQPGKVARVTAAPAGKIAGSAPRKPGASGSGAGTSRGGH